MRRRDLFIIAILLAFGMVLARGFWPRTEIPPLVFKPPAAPADAERRAEPDFTIIALPGPDGTTIQARFYRLERLPAAGNDLCTRLKERHAAIEAVPPQKNNQDSAAANNVDAKEFAFTQVKRACDDTVDEEGEPIKPGQRGALAGYAVGTLSTLDGKPAIDEQFAASLAQWMLAALRKAKTVEDVRETIESAHSFESVADGRVSLAFKRLYADITLLQAELCGAQAEASCRVARLVQAGKNLARLGRLENSEQHFKDMAAALGKAEGLIDKISEKSTRIDRLDDIASAYGYGGEGARNRNLLLHAADISRRIVQELTPEKDGADRVNFSNAIDTLAANLGRLAPNAPDRNALLREAIKTGELALAHDVQHFGGRESWATLINMAASERELFDATGEEPVIDSSVAHARKAMAALNARAQDSQTVRDYNFAYTRTVLAFSLAMRGKRMSALTDDEREAHFREAGRLLDDSEPLFHAINAQTYLRMAARARALLPKKE